MRFTVAVLSLDFVALCVKAAQQDSFGTLKESQSGQKSHCALSFESFRLANHLRRLAGELVPGPTADFLKMFNVCSRCDNFIRFGEARDGGYVLCADGLGEDLVGALSYGIHGKDGWGMDVASKYHIPVHEYDCYVTRVPSVCAGCNVSFHPECIRSAESAPQPNFATLSEHLSATGFADAAEGSLLLKMDIEGDEWPIFAGESMQTLQKFRQIAVEFHMVGAWGNHQRFLLSLKALERAGFVVLHLHGNNCQGSQKFDEFQIPHTLEVTYVRGKGCTYGPRGYTPLDAPNCGNLPEIDYPILPQ